VWRPGVLVTAAHALRREPASVSVILPDGRRVDAGFVGADPSTDLAVLRLPDEALPAVEVGDDAAVRAGHLVLAVGRSSAGDLTASHGIVNRVSGAWQTWLGGRIDRLIRLDGGLYEGLSGAPVADARGQVIGIASAALSRGYGIVVPAATVSRVVDALLSKGHVSRAFLGLSAQEVPLPASAARTGADAERAVTQEAGRQHGLLVTGLVPGGPAEQGGMLLGDIVTDVAGRRATDLHDLREALADRVGERVRVGMLRGGAPAELSLTVGQWPATRARC
jgi:S1-C subfamily serine protease